jgi:hypothetical protein
MRLQMSLADRAAVIGVILAKPREVNFALTSGSLIASENHWTVWLMVACGVFAGATTPT